MFILDFNVEMMKRLIFKEENDFYKDDIFFFEC